MMRLTPPTQEGQPMVVVCITIGLRPGPLRLGTRGPAAQGHLPIVLPGVAPLAIRMRWRRRKVFSLSSWPGVSPPSTPCRRSTDGRDTPGHDGEATDLVARSFSLPPPALTPLGTCLARTGPAPP